MIKSKILSIIANILKMHKVEYTYNAKEKCIDLNSNEDHEVGIILTKIKLLRAPDAYVGLKGGLAISYNTRDNQRITTIDDITKYYKYLKTAVAAAGYLFTTTAEMFAIRLEITNTNGEHWKTISANIRNEILKIPKVEEVTVNKFLPGFIIKVGKRTVEYKIYLSAGVILCELSFARD